MNPADAGMQSVGAITVRQAAFAELEPLALLFDQYRQFQGCTSDVPAAREFLRARFDHGESVIFIARQENAPVGFAQLYPLYTSVALTRVFILNDLFVHASARRQGVAAKLLDAVDGYANSLGAARLTLFVARANEAAQALYTSSGWKQDDQFHAYHRHLETGR
jgi:ribosomal protein S18 acetylase RimI-like enzyme